MKFFDRKYLLQVGDYETGDGLSIEDLQITFKVRKSVDNKKKIDKCSISVYNLSDKSLSFLETEYTVAILSCGYADNVVRLFYGEITDVETQKNGTDRITKIDISPSFTELTHTIISELVPEGGTIQDAVEAIRKTTKLSKGVYKGDNLKTKVVYGYPLIGTPRQMLNQISEVYGLQWKIDGQALFINDSDSIEVANKELAPVISITTGLIDRPYYYTGSGKKSKKDKTKKTGVKFTALLNPNVLPGSLVRVDFKGDSDYYRVEEVEFTGDYRGNNWYMICTCSIRLEE